MKKTGTTLMMAIIWVLATAITSQAATLHLNSSDFTPGENIQPFNVLFSNTQFTFAPASTNSTEYYFEALDGIYAYDQSTTNGMQITITASGYSFDFSSFQYLADAAYTLAVSYTAIDGSSDTLSYTTLKDAIVTKEPNLTNIVSVTIVSSGYTLFNNFDINNIQPLPMVITQAVSGIDATTATGNGTLSVLGGSNPTAYGICWSSTNKTPTTADSKEDLGAIAATGAFTASMTGLTAGTTYYVRAFARNAQGTRYGDPVVFVTKQIPTITWNTPAAITYGTPLSATQLNATANVAGTFAYSPASGALLNAGTARDLTVEFTPTDADNYSAARKMIAIDVAKANPVITWNPPAAITYGEALGTTQLSATANAAGTFTYTPASGALLDAGNAQNLTVEFTPADAANYNAATKNVAIDVAKANPVITWNTPAAITYGEALGATQLSATANVAGTFAYTPASGALLDAGMARNLTVEFTPTDADNYSVATKAVTIDVLTTSTGLYSSAAHARLAVLTNPLTHTLRITGITGKATLYVTTLNGKLVLSKDLGAEESVSLGVLPSGLYLIKIATLENSFTQTIRVE